MFELMVLINTAKYAHKKEESFVVVSTTANYKLKLV